MPQAELNLLASLIVVANERSFTRAAAILEVSPSALSHAIRQLETQVGVRLLARTTRSVRPTEAGERLLAQLRPVFAQIDDALNELGHLRDRPAGRIRLLLPRLASKMILAPKLARFAQDYPEVTLEVTTSDVPLDIVAEGFDAGIQFGELIASEMTTIRVSEDLMPAFVAAPRFFETHPLPQNPRELLDLPCVIFRAAHTGAPPPWKFEKDGESLVLAPKGPLIVDDSDLMLRAALDGVGIVYSFEANVAPDLQAGRLIRVLEDWIVPYPGFFLYFASRKHQPAALSALIETLRLSRG